MNELVKLASILTLCAFTTACSDPKPAKAPAPPQPQTQSDTAAPAPATQPNHLIREAIGVGCAEL
jgi:hypothetical protein